MLVGVLVLAAAVGARVAAPAPARPAHFSKGLACGVERWSVKTLTDPAARRVVFRARRSTIDTLRRQRAPVRLTAVRRGGIERTTFRVRAQLVSAKIEADGDVHLVIASPTTGHTMIAEFPSLACTQQSVAAARIHRARASLERLCGVQSRSGFTNLSGSATITGVGFFDFQHGQRGVAPNGVELHPVLSFTAIGCVPKVPPPPPPACPAPTTASRSTAAATRQLRSFLSRCLHSPATA